MSSVTHIGITVPDLDRAVQWYCDILGCELLAGPTNLRADDTYPGRAAVEVFGPDFQAARMAHLTTGNGVALELFEFIAPKMWGRDRPAEYRSAGFTHICVVDRAIEARVDAIRAGGGKVRTGIWDVFPGEPYRFCHCEDPFGNPIEIYTHSHEHVYANRSGDS